ncbi:bombyxin A-2 homolog [Leguminivora glycinivorella]|uniref:bombyxin A-2 homolog n=1 Tax=Leguminivora glycinivorella TaxID=1035111 RepID=UPI00200EB688|nr:bombyxin A-2 homolog [Leguminivora glycinivorella]
MMQAVLLLVVLSVVGQSVQQETAELQQLCGHKLAETVARLCEAERARKLGLYLTSPKRSRYTLLPHYAPYWLEAEDALRLGRGKRGGIVEECCKKACTVDELLGYCPPL